MCVGWLPFAFMGFDPHGFWFLFAATWFSAWTQPALAYGMARIMGLVLKLLHGIEQMLVNQQATMRAQLAVLERLEKNLEEEAE